MEPRGCNPWQSAANRPGPETAKTSCDRLPFGSHGKEGVDGSSPSEGSAKAPVNGGFLVGGFLVQTYLRVNPRAPSVEHLVEQSAFGTGPESV